MRWFSLNIERMRTTLICGEKESQCLGSETAGRASDCVCVGGILCLLPVRVKSDVMLFIRLSRTANLI